MNNPNGNLGEFLATRVGAQGALGGGVTTAYQPLGDAIRYSLLVATSGNLSPGATITVQFRQAENSGGTGAENLGAAQVYTVPGASDSPPPAAALQCALFDAPMAALNDDNTHIAAVVTTSAAANGIATFVRGGLRYTGANPDIA